MKTLREWLFGGTHNKVDLRDHVVKINLPRRSTVDVIAHPRPLPRTLRVVVKPCKDQWVAEVEPVDIVTQGNNIPHALRMAAEAIETRMEDDEKHGVNFWNRGLNWRSGK